MSPNWQALVLSGHIDHTLSTKDIYFGNILMQDSSRAEISRRKKKEVMRLLKNSFSEVNFAA